MIESSIAGNNNAEKTHPAIYGNLRTASTSSRSTPAPDINMGSQSTSSLPVRSEISFPWPASNMPLTPVLANLYLIFEKGQALFSIRAIESYIY
jgi:hypothetical protein